MHTGGTNRKGKAGGCYVHLAVLLDYERVNFIVIPLSAYVFNKYRPSLHAS